MFRGMRQLGILSKTNIDVPGEASTIMHQQKNVGAVELATMSFGQSFQLSPIRLLTSVSAVINGGHSIAFRRQHREYIERIGTQIIISAEEKNSV